MIEPVKIVVKISSKVVPSRFLDDGKFATEKSNNGLSCCWDVRMVLDIVDSNGNGTCRAIPVNKTRKLSIACVQLLRERFGQNI